jgi:hypothetical protein
MSNVVSNSPLPTHIPLLVLRDTIANFAPFFKISAMMRGTSAYIPHLLLALLDTEFRVLKLDIVKI